MTQIYYTKLFGETSFQSFVFNRNSFNEFQLSSPTASSKQKFVAQYLYRHISALSIRQNVLLYWLIQLFNLRMKLSLLNKTKSDRQGQMLNLLQQMPGNHWKARRDSRVWGQIKRSVQLPVLLQNSYVPTQESGHQTAIHYPKINSNLSNSLDISTD